MLKSFDFPFMFFCCLQAAEGAQVSSPACFCIGLAGINPVFPGF